MYERFTDEANQVVANALSRCHTAGISEFTPESLLLAILGRNLELTSLVCRDLCDLANRLRRLTGGDGRAIQAVRISSRSLRVFDLATEEADKLGSGCVGVEHLLLGIIREQESKPSYLTEFGITLDRVREEIRSSGGPKPVAEESPHKCPPTEEWGNEKTKPPETPAPKSRLGKLVFLERPSSNGSRPVDYNSGEYIVVRETPNAMYCIKPIGGYGCHEAQPFNLVGNCPWSVVSENDFDLESLCCEIEKFVESENGPKKEWCNSVYRGAKDSLRRLREIIAEKSPTPETPLLFSKRCRITEEVVKWCKDSEVATLPFNVVTALSSLGYLRSTPVDVVCDDKLVLDRSSKEEKKPQQDDPYERIFGPFKSADEMIESLKATQSRGVPQLMPGTIEFVKPDLALAYAQLVPFVVEADVILSKYVPVTNPFAGAKNAIRKAREIINSTSCFAVAYSAPETSK